MKTKIKNLLYAAAVLLMAAGCSSNPTEEVKELTGIGLSKSKIEIEVGQDFQLRVWYEPEEAEDLAPEVTWESTKPKVAKVSDTGKVTGVEEGSATIIATCGKFTAECKVDVVPEPEPVVVEAISLNAASMELQEGQSFNLIVSYEPEESERFAEEIVWSSSDETVATVSEGVVQAISEGNATITAKCGELSASCAISVIKYTNEITLNPSSLTFTADGGTEQVQLMSPTAWSLTYDADWFTISPTSGEGNAVLTVTVQAGTSAGPSKSAIVQFNNTENSATLQVMREGKPFLFTVSSTTKVTFSSGNLQYQPSTKTARFAPNQYDAIGAGNEAVSDTYSGWIDLFEWGKGDDLAYYNAQSTSGKFHQNFTDWGVNIPSSGNPWRTLTKDEWEYLYSKRSQANTLRGYAQVNGVKGYIFLPDDFVKPTGISFDYSATAFTVNTYTIEQWSALQDAGAVFLPANGYRSYDPSTYKPNVLSLSSCHYWSSTPHESTQIAWYFLIDPSENKVMFGTYRSYGNGVRLVKNAS